MKNRIVIKARLVFLFILSVIALSSCFKDNYDDTYSNYSLPLIPEDSVKVTKIWDNSKHCAFTSLVKYQGDYYCAFREGAGHVSDGGCIRILKSSDATKWEEAHYLSLSGSDLRDPNLSVTPDGRLMLICGRRVEGTQTLVSFLTDKNADFTAFQEVIVPDEISENTNWIWRANWFDNVCYGVRYGGDHTDLLKSSDGINWDFVSKMPKIPSEVQLGRMSNGNIVAFARTEGMGLVCYSNYPYNSWTIQYPNILFQGQAFVVTNRDKFLCVTRSANGISLYCNTTNRLFDKLYDFPSSGDAGYSGMILEEDRLLISYYSSHISFGDIFLAEIPLKCFIDRGILF